MPAAAVIPAPIAYVNIVAVKKLVVGFLVGAVGASLGVRIHCTRRLFQSPPFSRGAAPSSLGASNSASFTERKLECLRQALQLEYLCLE